MRLFSVFLTILSIWVICLIAPLSSFAAQPGRIIDSHYLTHFSVGETVRFTAVIKNLGTVADDYYIQVVLTNVTTGKEFAPYPTSGDGSIGAGKTMVLTTGLPAPIPGGIGAVPADWTSVAGIYSVTILLYNTGVPEVNRISGREPVHVGSATESLAAFPKVLDLGTLQYGRYMHPMPIEISWNFFGFNSQIRKDRPWYMRIYTDNQKRYQGIYGAVYSGRIATQEGGGASAMGSPAGLISEDGKYTIPLKIWCLNFGPDVEEGWDANLLGPPPVQEDHYWKGPLLDDGTRDKTRVVWERVPDYMDMTADTATWRKLIGQDPFDTHYVSDSNPAGDFTLPSPFQVFVAYETSPTAVIGKYTTDMIIEIYSP